MFIYDMLNHSVTVAQIEKSHKSANWFEELSHIDICPKFAIIG